MFLVLPFYHEFQFMTKCACMHIAHFSNDTLLCLDIGQEIIAQNDNDWLRPSAQIDTKATPVGILNLGCNSAALWVKILWSGAWRFLQNCLFFSLKWDCVLTGIVTQLISTRLKQTKHWKIFSKLRKLLKIVKSCQNFELLSTSWKLVNLVKSRIFSVKETCEYYVITIK